MPSWATVAVIGASCVLLPAAARAQSNELPIELDASACPTLDRAELDKLLSVEFRTLSLEPRESPERVRVVCDARVARVTIDGSRSVNEVVLAATAPSAWPRLLALSVSEIVIRSRAQLPVEASPTAPAPLPAPPVPEPGPPVPASAPEAQGAVFVAIALRRVLADDTWLSGPELGGELALAPFLRLAADARLELGATDTDVARVRWLSARGAVLALLGGRMGAWRLSAGPGVCLGYVRLSPAVTLENATGHVVSGAWSGPELAARAQYGFGSRWFALGGLDAGLVTWPVAGLQNDERRLIHGDGAWLSLELGVGASF
jgi:hypothetical protein